MNVFDNALAQLNYASKLAKVDPDILAQLQKPQRIIEVNIPLRVDNKLQFFSGFRVQYNNWLGPYKGGLRYHPKVDMNEVKALGFWMMIKNALIGVPFGGAKGGIQVDVKKLSSLEQLTRQFCKLLSANIGPFIDVPAPDVNTNAQIMDWFADEYVKKFKIQNSKFKINELQAVVTGKSIKNGGSEGREEATALGGFYVLNQLLKKLKSDQIGLKLNKPLTVAIQGFGNVGANIAEILFNSGFKIVALSDSKGGVLNQEGLDIKKIKKHKKDSGTVANFQDSKSITNEELLDLPVDILIPAALEGVIDKNASKIKAKIILEMANGPTTPEADKILKKKKIMVIPDVLANAGGVSVSYFEWYQNINKQRWSLKQIEKKLEEKMLAAFDEINKKSENKKITFREAAFILALERLTKHAK